VFVAGVPRTYEMHLASPAFASMTCPDRDPGRPTVLPPVQPSKCGSAGEETESSDVGGRLPSCDDDDSVPPVVRFKNRYRRAQQLEEQQKQHCDWNHNDTSKMKYSPVQLLQQHQSTDDMYYTASPSKILPDLDVVGCNLDEKTTVVEDPRPCEKRSWSHVASDVDVGDRWNSSSKITCRKVAVDSRRIDVGQLEYEKLAAKGYYETHQRNLEYQNCVISCAEPKCEHHSAIICVVFRVLYIFITSFTLTGLVQYLSVTELLHNFLKKEVNWHLFLFYFLKLLQCIERRYSKNSFITLTLMWIYCVGGVDLRVKVSFDYVVTSQPRRSTRYFCNNGDALPGDCTAVFSSIESQPQN